MIARPDRAWLIVLAALLLATFAQGQEPLRDPGAGAPQGHAWLALPVGASDRPVLMHVPPRASAEFGPAGAPFGVLRKSMELSETPAAMAAAGSRVYVAFNTGERTPAMLFSIGAVASGLGDLWADDTPGRMRSERPFAVGQRVISLAAHDRALAALITDSAGARRVLALEAAGWADRTPATPISERTQLVATGEGFALAELIAEPSSALRVIEVSVQGENAWQWGSPRLLRAPAGLVSAGAAAFWLGAAGDEAGRWIVAGVVKTSGESESREIIIAEAMEGRSRALARVPMTGARWSIAPAGRPDRVVLALEEPLKDPAKSPPTSTPTGSLLAPPAGEAPTRSYRVIEVSASSGAVLFDGPAAGTSPISSGAFRILAVTLLAVMAVVLVFVLRPDPAGPELSLPEGWALAEPGRRMVAGGLDFLLALIIASRVWGVGVFEVFSAEAMVSGVGPWALLSALGVGLVLSTLGEAFLAASPGKFLMGIRVGRVLMVEGEPELHTPGVRAAVIRNGLKWLAPPLALLSLFDAEGRGKPDRLSRTVVVVPAERDPRRPDEQEP
ncbi:MAG: RDD family protein [Planctomycetota bacterium]|nr:RDD family protein [Planctomycetota bacterium]